MNPGSAELVDNWGTRSSMFSFSNILTSGTCTNVRPSRVRYLEALLAG